MNDTISESEWKIMKILWKSDTLTLSELVEQLSNSKWSYSTIKTLLKRLVDKGAVSADKTIGNNFRYHAVLLEGDCKKSESKTFLSKVFDGSLPTFLAAFLQDEALSAAEINELKQMIEQAVPAKSDANQNANRSSKKAGV